MQDRPGLLSVGVAGAGAAEVQRVFEPVGNALAQLNGVPVELADGKAPTLRVYFHTGDSHAMSPLLGVVVSGDWKDPVAFLHRRVLADWVACCLAKPRCVRTVVAKLQGGMWGRRGRSYSKMKAAEAKAEVASRWASDGAAMAQALIEVQDRLDAEALVARLQVASALKKAKVKAKAEAEKATKRAKRAAQCRAPKDINGDIAKEVLGEVMQGMKHLPALLVKQAARAKMAMFCDLGPSADPMHPLKGLSAALWARLFKFYGEDSAVYGVLASNVASLGLDWSVARACDYRLADACAHLILTPGDEICTKYLRAFQVCSGWVRCRCCVCNAPSQTLRTHLGACSPHRCLCLWPCRH